MKSTWRAVLFVICFALALGGGLWFKRLSAAPQPLPPEGPDTVINAIDILVDNPDVKVNAVLDVYSFFDKNRRQTFHADLQVDPRIMSDLLITSNLSATGVGGPFNILKPEPSSGRPLGVYVPPNFPPLDKAGLTTIATFSLPKVFASSWGTFSADLPDIEEDAEQGSDYPVVIAYHANRSDAQLLPIPTEDYRIPASRNPTDYGVQSGTGRKLYWVPANFTAKVTLEDASQYVRDARIDTDIPPNGAEVGMNFVWTGGYGLAPSLSATKWSSIEDRSSDEFYSGLLIGLAAAAALALFVEFPDKLPTWSRRRSKKRTRRLDGIDATTTSRVLTQHHAGESSEPP